LPVGRAVSSARSRMSLLYRIGSGRVISRWGETRGDAEDGKVVVIISSAKRNAISGRRVKRKKLDASAHLEVQSMVLDIPNRTRSVSSNIAELQVESPVLINRWDCNEKEEEKDQLLLATLCIHIPSPRRIVDRAISNDLPPLPHRQVESNHRKRRKLTCVMFKAVISPSTNSAL
jgi:hypothetical protein